MLLYVPHGFRIQTHIFTSIKLTWRLQVRIPGVSTNTYIVILLSLDEHGEARQILIGWITVSVALPRMFLPLSGRLVL